MGQPVLVGAVAYDPKVVEIWEGFREYFAEAGVPTDYILFSNYERQVEALFDGVIDIAWNTNLAYLRAEARAGGGCQVLGMRNTDVDYTSRLIARRGSGIQGWEDLRQRTFAVGSADSVQAAIVPLHYARAAGVASDMDAAVLRFNVDVGKHGDTGTSELDVLRAIVEGKADAGAVGSATWLTLLESGKVDANVLESVWTSPGYSHCNFTALPTFDAREAANWTSALLQMDYRNPRWRRLMDMEGLSQWLPGDKSGYRELARMLDLPHPA
jgi:phosphonate transport system substrate-binding protein